MNLLQRFVAINRKACRWLEARWPEVFAERDYMAEFHRRVHADLATLRPSLVLEAGSANRPYLLRNQGFRYVGLDIDERPDCTKLYDAFLVQSIEKPIPVAAGMVISITLLEHVPDTGAAVAAIHDCLVNGGTTHHYLPSKYHPYALVLRMVGPRLQKSLIRWLRPASMRLGGYPAFFNHCSPAQMRQIFIHAGFKAINIKPYYRATDYFAFFLPAYLAVAAVENIAEYLGLDLLSAGFVISARKD